LYAQYNGFKEGAVWQFETEFSEIITRSPSVKSFRFPVSPEDAPFEAGQFFFVNIMVNGKKATHHFTISSSPLDRGYLEFTKRITDSDYSRALGEMQPGGWAQINGPMGEFILPDKPRPLAFLTGGIGITPAWSMLNYMYQKKLGYDAVLIYCNATTKDIPFREQLDKMAAESDSIRVVHALSEETSSGWKGERGLLDKEMVKRVIPDYAERLFYLSGPPRMNKAVEKELKELKVSGKKIKQDTFTGYD